jgi:S-adenosyl methyltransferase
MCWAAKDHFAADRAAADSVLKIAPDTRDLAVHNREFLGRAVTYTCGCGIDQFLDVGTGLPTQDSVHQVAQRADPKARVVYVDNDPSVRAHADALLCTDEQTAFLEAGLRDPDAILTAVETRRLIDFDQPVALLLVAILHFISDADDPAALVSRFVEELAPGSFLVISHVTSEGASDAVRAQIDATYRNAPVPLHPRSRAEIAALFCGLPLVEPGLTEVSQWRPERHAEPGSLRALCGVVRIP